MVKQLTNYDFYDERSLFSLDRVASCLDVSVWTVRKWVAQGKIVTVKLGARRLVPVTEVQRLATEGLE